MKTVCVIVQYGPEEPLNATLAALAKNCPLVETIVIDNNKDNVGYCKGANLGIQKALDAGAGYIWLLSPDAVPLVGADTAMIERFKSSPRAAIVGSMQIDPDDPDIIRHGGTLLAYPTGVHLGGKRSQGACNVPSRQKWVNSASMMIRASAVQFIGLLDERFFLFFGDSDYCYNARKCGYEVWYEPGSIVQHKLSTSRTAAQTAEAESKLFAEKWGVHQESLIWRTLDTITAPMI